MERLVPAPRALNPGHRGATTNNNDNANANDHRGHDPMYNNGWQPGLGGARPGPPGSSEHEGEYPRGPYAGHGNNDANAAANRATSSGTFPVLLPGALGSVGYKDRPMFDDKLTTEAEFKFDGVNHGSAWKTKVERYMVYKA